MKDQINLSIGMTYFTVFMSKEPTYGRLQLVDINTIHFTQDLKRGDIEKARSF